MSPVKTYKRKLLNFSINRNMQLRMIGKISLILFVSQLLSGLIFFYFSNQEITASFQMFHVKARNFLDFLWPVVAASVVISLALGFFASLFFPKSIAGGLYRIEEDLKKVNAEGDLSVQIRLRDGDQVAALAAQINLLLLNQKKRIAGVQESIKKIEILCAAGTEPSNEALTQIRMQLQESVIGLQTD